MKQQWWPHCGFSLMRLKGSDGSLVWRQDIGLSSFFRTNVVSGVSPFGPGQSVRLGSIYAKCMHADDARIVIGTDRTSNTSGRAEYDYVADLTRSYTVMCLDANGRVIWKADTGGCVTDLVIIPGVGVAVVHATSHDVSDPVLLKLRDYDDHSSDSNTSALSSGTSSSFSSHSSLSSNSSSFSQSSRSSASSQSRSSFSSQSSSSGDEIIAQCGLNELYPTAAFPILQGDSATSLATRMRLTTNPFIYNRYDGNQAISGSNPRTGITFEYDDAIAGPGGLREIGVIGFYNQPSSVFGSRGNHATDISCISLANVTLLDLDTGRIIWRQRVESSDAPRTTFVSPSAVPFAPFAVCATPTHILTFHEGSVEEPAHSATILDFAGNVVSRLSFVYSTLSPDGRSIPNSGILKSNRNATTDGNFFWVDGNRYDMTGVKQLGFASVKPPYFYDSATNLLWGNSGTINYGPHDPATGAPVVGSFNNGYCKISSGLVINQTGQTAGDLTNITKWRYRSANPISITSHAIQEFQDDVIVATTRTAPAFTNPTEFYPARYG